MYNFFCITVLLVYIVLILKGSVSVYFTGISEGKSPQFVATDITVELWTAVPLTLLKSNSSLQFMPFKAIVAVFLFSDIVRIFCRYKWQNDSVFTDSFIISQTQDLLVGFRDGSVILCISVTKKFLFFHFVQVSITMVVHLTLHWDKNSLGCKWLVHVKFFLHSY